MRFNLLTWAIVATGALAQGPIPTISASQAIDLLNNLVDGLQSTGDVRVKLEQATPILDAQNVIPFHTVRVEALNTGRHPC
jgi:hypothetical protein